MLLWLQQLCFPILFLIKIDVRATILGIWSIAYQYYFKSYLQLFRKQPRLALSLISQYFRLIRWATLFIIASIIVYWWGYLKNSLFELATAWPKELIPFHDFQRSNFMLKDYCLRESSILFKELEFFQRFNWYLALIFPFELKLTAKSAWYF